LKNLILIIATLAMAACNIKPAVQIKESDHATPTPDQIMAASEAGDRYFDAKRNNTLIATCWNARACERMFGLTKIFINQYADMGVQHSDRYTVTPYMPDISVVQSSIITTNLGKVSLGAVRIPGNDDASTIVLSANCSGLNRELDALNNSRNHIKSDPAFEHTCLDKLSTIYEKFKPFIDSRMR